jgi:hypothetical protein
MIADILKVKLMANLRRSHRNPAQGVPAGLGAGVRQAGGDHTQA